MKVSELARSYDPQALKADVNLVAVVLDTGVELHPSDDHRLVGHCPFHEDAIESFAVWQWEDSQNWACGCWSCNPFRGGTAALGDLFDYLQAFYHVGFRQAIELAVGYVGRDLPDLPAMPTPKGKPPDMGKLLAQSDKHHDGVTLQMLLQAREVDVPAQWVHDQWRVCDGDGEVLIPHFDGAGTLTALKHRSPEDGWTSRSVRGSALEHLYGEWRARGGAQRPVLLCEGESDTWTVAYLFDGEPVDVLGLPSGAAANPKDDWLDQVAGRDLTLLLDADRAGRDAARKWAMLATERGARVNVANLPDGSDCTSAGPDEVQRCINEAWPVIDVDQLSVKEAATGYVRFDKQGNPITLSDFVMHPVRLVDLGGSMVYEVVGPGKADVQFLPDAERASTDRMRRWCAARSLSWKGSNRDVSDLLELLKSKSIFLPRVRGTDVVGLHGNVFVMPDESIGSNGWGYVPPENDISLGASINLGDGEWDDELIGALSELHNPNVVTPILGWVAAAPLRSIVPKFPILGVFGGSGYGKTTLLEVILAGFGFWTT